MTSIKFQKVRNFIIIFCFCGFIALLALMNVGTLVSVVEEGEFSNSETFISEVNQGYPTEFSFKYCFINFNAFMQKIQGHNTMNGIVRLKNGYLAETVDKTEVGYKAYNTAEFCKALNEDGIAFLYVSTPYLICAYDKELPLGMEDYSNENADEFLTFLGEENIPALDLREYYHSKGIDHYSLFFRTDHHWTPEGAFLGYQEVIRRMEELMQFDIDVSYTDRSSYTEETFEGSFLGANGKRTGIPFAEIEDITVLSPAFDTDITFSVPSEGIFREGEFRESVLDYSNIDATDYFGKNPYHVYIGDEYPLVHMRNAQAPCDKKILLIKDSFALPVQAYMSTCFTAIDAIDLRLYGDETVLEYVRETEPDMVVVLYNPYMLLTDAVYEFGALEK